MKITYVYHKFPHHAKHSGYDLLVKYLENYPFPANSVVERLRDIDVSHFSRLPHFSRHHTNRYYFPLEFGLGVAYSNADVKPFLSNDDSHVIKAVYDALEHQEYATRESVTAESEKHIIHFMYGHLSYRYIKSFPLFNHIKVVLTIHEPPELIARWKFKNLFSKADAIIVLSQYQKLYTRQLIDADRIFVVPHGVDTEFYRPPHCRPKNKIFTTISVGHYMRDISTLVGAIRLLRSRGLVCTHNVVTFKEHFSYFKNLPNVRLSSGISDEELRTLYQDADCLLLPLTDSTANNALLESMACGTPPIITKVGGVKEYVSRKCALFVPKGNISSIYRHISKYHNKPARLHRLGIRCRNLVMNYTWDKVALRVQKVYDAL